MKLFFDENVGRGVPEALRLVGLRDVQYVVSMFRAQIERGTPVPDEQWIPIVGARGWLLFSEDLGILEAEEQRKLLIRSGVGAVFLHPGRVKRRDVLELLLRKWTWLETIDANEPRPFAFILNPSGRARREARVA